MVVRSYYDYNSANILLFQSQQKTLEKVWNMLQINIKDTQNDANDVAEVLLSLTLNICTPF